MVDSVEFVVSHLMALAKGVIAVWLPCWAIRYRSELDYKLDKAGRLLRWTVILLGVGLTFLPGPSFATARVVGTILVMAFFAWPNLAYYLRRFFSDPAESGPPGDAG